MAISSKQTFINAIVRGYDRWNPPEQQSMENWVENSEIFSLAYPERGIEAASLGKLRSLLEAVTRKIEVVRAQSGNPEVALKDLSEELTARQKEILALPKLPVVQTGKYQLLRHVFINAYLGSSEAERNEIHEAAEKLRPELNKHLSFLEKTYDSVIDRFDVRDRPKVILAFMLLLFCNAGLVYYVATKLIFPYFLSTLVPIALNPAYCPLIAIKIGTVVVGSCTWLINHQAVQIFFFLGLHGIDLLAHKLQIKNQKISAFITVFDKINNCLPFGFIVNRHFDQFLVGARRIGMNVITELNHTHRKNVNPDLLMRQIEVTRVWDYQKATKTLLVWIDLIEHVEKNRAAAPV
jgi:hypothetical protein